MEHMEGGRKMVEEGRSTGAPPIVRTLVLADLVEELMAEASEAHTAWQSQQPRGPVTRLAAVDLALGGFLAPGVHQLQAAPGVGKTAFCLQAAVECGFPTLFVSTEMPRLELFRRVIARTTNTYLGRFRSGELSPDEVRARALAAARQAPRLAIMDGTLAFPAPGEHILPTAEALRTRFETRGLLVVIDSLQVWARGAGGGATEYELINAGLTAASALAARLSCPVLCVSHRNRPGQKTGGLHAGKGSGDLEYAAETVLELTPAEGATAVAATTQTVLLSLHKNRHGPAGVEIPLEFEGRLQAFREAVRPGVGGGSGPGAPRRGASRRTADDL
jgi:replicative DNA helicase